MEKYKTRKNRVFVTGHKGMAGSAIVKKLKSLSFEQILVADRLSLDLRDSAAVKKYFQKNKPEIVILCAAKVGGIKANIDYPVEFLLDNLKIQNNIIESSFENRVEKVCFIGSSCIYPKNSPQPMKEEYLLNGPLEPTNEGYALAKITGLRLLQYYHKQYGMKAINLMPSNMYGENDHFDLEKSHVFSALVKRFVDAKNSNLESVTLWGTGKARREFLNVSDFADAVLYFLEKYDSPEIINIGPGEDISIYELAYKIANKVGFAGSILWDTTKPDGMLKKCMDVTKMKDAGYSPKVTIDEGIEQMIEFYHERIIGDMK